MDTYEFYIFMHIAGAFMLLGAAGLSTGTGIALGRVDRASTAKLLLTMMRRGELFVTTPGAVVVLVFGLLLIGETPYGFGDDPWLDTSVVLWVVAMAIGHGFLLPQNKKAIRMSEALGDQPVDAALKAQLTKPLIIGAGLFLNFLFLVFLYLMVAKPGS